MRVQYTAVKLALMTGLAGAAGLAAAANPVPAAAPYGQPLNTPFPPQPQFQAPPPRMYQMPPQQQFQAPPPPMYPMPPQPQFQAPLPPAAGPVTPGMRSGSPYNRNPYQAWESRDNDGPFDRGPWSNRDGARGVNDWFGDWGSLFDGTGRLEMDFEMDMSMDFDAEGDADADSNTQFRGDNYYRGYEGYRPYGQYPLPPAPMLTPPPAPMAPVPQGAVPPATNQAPVPQ